MILNDGHLAFSESCVAEKGEVLFGVLIGTGLEVDHEELQRYF
jgi:hypothetical protein